jgi:hypothetical protein
MSNVDESPPHVSRNIGFVVPTETFHHVFTMVFTTCSPRVHMCVFNVHTHTSFGVPLNILVEMKWVFGCTLLPSPIKTNKKHAVILHENVRNAQISVDKPKPMHFFWGSAGVSGQEVLPAMCSVTTMVMPLTSWWP